MPAMYQPNTRKPEQDCFGRYPSDCPVSTGKRKEPKSDDLLWFDKINRHGGYCSSNFLIAYSHACGTRRNAYNMRQQMKELWRESNTPHGGRYLVRHHEQSRNVRNKFGNYLIYSLRDPAKRALQDGGNWADSSPDTSGSAQHDMERCFVTQSIELGCLREPNTYRFVHFDEVLKTFDIGAVFPVEFSYHVTGNKYDMQGTTYQHRGYLKPDAIFGIEYLEEKLTVIYLLEMDCRNETIRSKNMKDKSHTRSILQYRQFLGGKAWKKDNYFGCDKNISVMGLFVTKSDYHMRSVMERARELSKGGNGMNYLAYNVLNPNADPAYFTPPPVLYRLFDEPWERPSGKGFRLS